MNPGNIGGTRVLSPLCHHCTTTAPLLHHYCTTTAPPLHQYCATTTPLLHHHRSSGPQSRLSVAGQRQYLLPLLFLSPWYCFGLVDQTSDVLLCSLAALYLLAVTLPCFLSGITWRSWNAWQQWKRRHGGTTNLASKNDCFYSRAYLLTAPFLCHVIGS